MTAAERVRHLEECAEREALPDRDVYVCPHEVHADGIELVRHRRR